MSYYASQDDVFASPSQFLSPSSSSSTSRKSPSRQSISNRKSNASLRGSSTLAPDDDAVTGRHSLAHELAVALMPEPSAGSKLLAEEFGIEYDEGAEGIDEDNTFHHQQNGVQIHVADSDAPSFADELGENVLDASFGDPSFREADPDIEDAPPEFDPTFGSPSISMRQKKSKRPEQDAMEVLANDLESTDKFLGHLRTIDNETGSSTSQQPALERLASDVIRRMNDSVRDREGQVRELLEYEREFRKIAGEVGGSDVLGQLAELQPMEEEVVATKSHAEPPRVDTTRLDILEEESRSPGAHQLSPSNDWELDPDRHHLDDGDDEDEVATPIKDTFPSPPTLVGPPTPAKTIPQLAHLRSFTASLITSLSTISEQAQVNGAATADAGRKIRALKNKLGGWRTDWDSAERSRLRIERWEAGVVDGEDGNAPGTPVTPTRLGGAKRVNGREVVQEHLHAFELALADAAMKTQAIMTR